MINKQKLSEFDLQMKTIQEKKKRYIEIQSMQLIKMIKKIGAFDLPSEILVGSLIDTVQSYQKEEEVINKWQQLGYEFLNVGDGKGGTRTKSSFRASSN